MREEQSFYYQNHKWFVENHNNKFLLLQGKRLLAVSENRDELDQYAAANFAPGETLVIYCSQNDASVASVATKPIQGPAKTPGCVVALLICVGLVAIFAIIGKMTDGGKSPAEQQKEKDESIFSAWDGSVPALKTYIQERMNDPESFEHVETKYLKKEDHYIVIMKYRGKNAFNATITKTVTAKVSLGGAVMEILLDQ